MTETQTTLFEHLRFEHLKIRILDLFRASNFVLRIYVLSPCLRVRPSPRLPAANCLLPADQNHSAPIADTQCIVASWLYTHAGRAE